MCGKRQAEICSAFAVREIVARAVLLFADNGPP
jgi:hypothetical protein